MTNGKGRSIGLRVSAEEYQLLDQVAKLVRRKVSDYCRVMALERAEQDLRTVNQKEESLKQPSAA